jgi:4-amino-4-deoxy-L-arabinose transferase-like glycosyltransferase
MVLCVTADRDTDASQPSQTIAGFDRRVLVVGAVLFVVLMAVSPWYGFDRDELYFFDAGRHLQGGYVDQPLFTPLLARITLDLFGVSLPGLRLWPALAGWATVVIGGLTARELGGTRRAQLIAAIGTATMPVLLAVDHLTGPTAFDILAWSGLALIVIHIGRTGDVRWWPVAGAVLGLGLTNKHSIAFFAIAFTVGAVISGGRRDVVNRWFAIGAALAVAFTLPDVIWQAQHGWATITMTRHLNQENGGIGNVPSWLVGQLLMTAFVMIWVWIPGLRSLWRSSRPLWRSLAWAYGLLFVFFMLTSGAKIYYLAGAYVYLLAAGAVVVDERLTAGIGTFRHLMTSTALCTAIAWPLVLPLLPASDIGWTAAVNEVPTESLGWHSLVASVDTAWRAIPAEQRQHAVIMAADYGEAGAINELGRGTGLPIAVGDQNSEWWWGPGNPDATTVLAVAPGPQDVTGYKRYLTRFFGSVKTVATLTNPQGVHNQEWGGHLYVCTEPREQWALMWPRLRHYD